MNSLFIFEKCALFKDTLTCLFSFKVHNALIPKEYLRWKSYCDVTNYLRKFPLVFSNIHEAEMSK